MTIFILEKSFAQWSFTENIDLKQYADSKDIKYIEENKEALMNMSSDTFITNVYFCSKEVVKYHYNKLGIENSLDSYKENNNIGSDFINERIKFCINVKAHNEIMQLAQKCAYCYKYIYGGEETELYKGSDFRYREWVCHQTC
jgi:hypothetical protein